MLYHMHIWAPPQPSHTGLTSRVAAALQPEYESSCLGRLVFWWYNPLVNYGAHVALEMEHIWQLHPNDSATGLYPRFHKFWDEEVARVEELKAQPGQRHPDKEKPGLFRPIIRFGIKQVVKGGCILLLAILMQFARPLLMQQILLVVEGSPEARVSPEHAWIPGLLTQGGGDPAPLASRFLRIPTHFPLNLHAIPWELSTVGPPG